MTEPTKKDEPKVEQWMREVVSFISVRCAGIAFRKGMEPYFGDEEYDAALEIISRHASKRDEAVDELVRAARAVVELAAFENVNWLCSALAAMEVKK